MAATEDAKPAPSDPSTVVGVFVQGFPSYPVAPFLPEIRKPDWHLPRTVLLEPIRARSRFGERASNSIMEAADVQMLRHFPG